MPQPAAIPSQPHRSRGCPPAAGTRTCAGVPLTIWPAIPPPPPCPGATCATPCPHRLTTQAAAQIITAFTGPGDLVVIPAAHTPAFIEAAAAAGRRVLAVCGGPAQAGRLARGLGPPYRPLADLRPGGPGLLLHAACPHAGRAALAVIIACATPGCPPPGSGGSAGSDPDPGLLYAACQRVLRPGGLLAVLTNAVQEPGQPGEVIAYARAAGLVYIQHIIAVHAAIHTSRLVPAADGTLTLHPGAAPAHLPIHSDVLLFAALEGPRHD
jgi:hypothetical protein